MNNRLKEMNPLEKLISIDIFYTEPNIPTTVIGIGNYNPKEQKICLKNTVSVDYSYILDLMKRGKGQSYEQAVRSFHQAAQKKTFSLINLNVCSSVVHEFLL